LVYTAYLGLCGATVPSRRHPNDSNSKKKMEDGRYKIQRTRCRRWRKCIKSYWTRV